MATPPPPSSPPTNESSSINADTIISKIKGITEKINALKVNMQQRIQTMQTQLEASTQSSDEESQRLQGEIIKLSKGLEKTNIENSELKAELAKLEAINSELTTLEGKVNELIESNANTAEQEGGYQYKSKSKNNTRSKRIIKLNKFGLLKSRSKTNKKSKKMMKKPLKSKLKRRVKGKSVKKGGAKKKKSHNKTKKHLKSKRSRRRHK